LHAYITIYFFFLALDIASLPRDHKSEVLTKKYAHADASSMRKLNGGGTESGKISNWSDEFMILLISHFQHPYYQNSLAVLKEAPHITIQCRITNSSSFCSVARFCALIEIS
jgi:hypothetical protein